MIQEIELWLSRPRLSPTLLMWLSRPRLSSGYHREHTRGRVCYTASRLLAMLLLALATAPTLGQTPGATPAASTQPLTENKAPATNEPLPAEWADLDAPRVVRLGNQRLLQGDPESALQAYEHAKTLAPDAREIDFVEGLAEYARGDYERARTLFENAATAANPALVDDAMYSVAATYHQQALQNTDDPKAKIAALEQAMSHYQTVLAHQSDHEAARDANFKAATAWRQLKLQQQQQEQQQQDDKNKEKNEDKDKDKGKEKSDQQQDQQENDDQEKQDKQESDDQKQDKDQQKSESDPSEDPSQEEQDKEQEQKQQQAQQSKEDVSKEQAQRQLREMMQAIRDRKKKQRKQQRPVQIVPVDKDW